MYQLMEVVAEGVGDVDVEVLLCVRPQSAYRGRDEIRGVYLPSQVECTMKFCT